MAPGAPASEPLQAVLVPASAASAGASGSAAAVPEADTPSSLADQPAHGSSHNLAVRAPSREGSGRHAITITADGSGRGGRAYFQAMAGGSRPSSRPSSRAEPSREARWHQAAAEESALEQHSLQAGPHPAAAAGHGVTAGQAALQDVRGAAAAQQNSEPREYTATWLVEDGSPRAQPTVGPLSSTSNGGAPSPAGPGKQPGGGGGNHGGGSGKGGSSHIGGRKDEFSNAVVMIEEPEERKYFSWAAYWGSLPKKLKGGLAAVPGRSLHVACVVASVLAGGPTSSSGWLDASRHLPLLMPHRFCCCVWPPHVQAAWTRGCRCPHSETSSGPGWAPSWVGSAAACGLA